MTMQDFINEGKKTVIAYLTNAGINGVNISDREIIKSNDLRLHAITVRKEGSLAGANVYIDDLFERHESGCNTEKLMDELKERCKEAACVDPPSEITADCSFELEDIKDRLSVRLLDTRCNRSYMRDRPYIDAGNGFALTAQINYEESIKSEWVINVTNDMLPFIGCSAEKLLTEALRNTARMESPVLLRLSTFFLDGNEKDLLSGKTSIEDEPETVFALTNESKFKGSSVLFYPGVLERVAEVLNSGYYVLPSSIHELIVIPDSMGLPLQSMVEMLKRGNEQYVDEEEFLSDRVLHYDMPDGKLVTAAGYRNKDKAKDIMRM